MNSIDNANGKCSKPEQPLPENSAEAVRRLHNNLCAINLTNATNASDDINELFPRDVKDKRSEAARQQLWKIIESLMHLTEHTTADRLTKIAIVALREILYRKPTPAPDEISAHMINRLEEEVARLKPETKK